MIKKILGFSLIFQNAKNLVLSPILFIFLLNYAYFKIPGGFDD
jgi:hypothetical protein